ncbi:universal stress protein [Puia dinghuensis]|uniref:UspA domain-containing protein n=1 Tax=Puia dinghuensis TaxID=1792502 RepID=A0A8J2XW50_9BACT|nr:universal stress protein [Puia dinghuensis]GGB21184.1 hypothetical protein GCM10011511_51180 [Puia dinghuensis]
MKKILVLVDFSAPSVNAVDYAADLARDKDFGEVILMANLFVPLFEQIVPTADLTQVDAVDISGRKEKMMQQLQKLQTRLEKNLPPAIKTSTVIGSHALLRSVLHEVAADGPSLVIVGISKRNTMEDCSIGRQIIPLAKVTPVPLLVIPPESHYRPIEDVLVARAPADASQPVPPGTTEALVTLFGEVHYQQYALEKKDMLQGVLQAAAERKVQIIIALPGKRSFFYNLTHQNIMHGIVLNAEKPVLILK